MAEPSTGMTGSEGALSVFPAFLSIFVTVSVLFSFEDDSHSLSAADAQSGKAEFEVTAFHFVHHGDDDSGAAAADRMAERDASAVQVNFVCAYLEFTQTADRL